MTCNGDLRPRRRRALRRAPRCGCDQLRRALQHGELELHYQPVVDLITGLVTGLEALVRWRHPDDGVLPAGAFIPTAERCGLIADVDAWVLEAAVAQIAAWEEDVLIAPGFRVAVNVSAVEFADAALVRRIASTLQEHGARPECLTVELTETSELRDLAAAHRNVRALKQLGVHVGLDDFGAEYATFERLRSLPFDLVKLDREVTTSASSRVGAAFVRAIVGLGDGLDMQVIAEGIETAAQAAVAAGLGCTLAQGHLWSPPLPASAVTRILESGTGLRRTSGEPMATGTGA